MMSPDARLVYMANQIARNLEAQGESAATITVADHIAAFWDPRMKARIFAMQAGGDADALSPIAARAIAMLRTRGAPPPGAGAGAIDQPGVSDAG